MPTKHLQSKQPKMARKKSEKVLNDRNLNICNGTESKSCSEPLSLRIMKEMDVSPLDDKPYKEDYEFQMAAATHKVRKSTFKDRKAQHRSLQKSPSADSALKIQQDDYILFRKQQHPQLLGEDHCSKLSDEIILYVFHWLPKPMLVKCSSVCKRWKFLSCDESLWRRYDFGRKVVKPYVLETLLTRGVHVLRLAMSEIKSPVFSNDFYNAADWFCSVQYLDLSMATISASGLSQLLSVCCQLKKLSLENCSMNDDCCSAIAQNIHLDTLNMAMCSGITPEGVHSISMYCNKLKEWNLAWTNLSTTCFDGFLQHIPHTLKRLNLSGHRESLDDGGVLTVASRCPDLIELDISDCPLLTNMSFEAIVKNCPKLQHLHTSRSYNIPTDCNRLLRDMTHFTNLEIFRTLTDEALESLREYMPRIQINQNVFSTIARPTTGIRRTSIWGLRVRD